MDLDYSILLRLAKAQGKTVEDIQKEISDSNEVEEIAEIRGVQTKIIVAEQQNLPFWGEQYRGVPNSVLRSALFTATKRGKREYFERVKIASLDGINVLFTGPRLDQADLDVWEQCLHIARNSLGSKIQFTAHNFLKAIGRDTGKSQHEWLKGAFARLRTSDIELSDGKRSYFGALISHGQRNEETGLYEISLNPKIARLYSDNGWTGQDWSQRKSLQGKPLALWLHGFYSTHKKPFLYHISTLHSLCGSETGEMKHFKEKLKESLVHLSEVTGWTCQIKDDKLEVKK